MPPAESTPARHLIYLHGRIVQEEQSSRPLHPRFGRYEMAEIIEAFRDRGFIVRGDIRPKSATVSESAERVVEQIRKLMESGVPSGRITVVGASMGGAIAIEASARLQNPGVRFALLGACLSGSVRERRDGADRAPAGRFLSVREASDDLTEPCPAWNQEPASRSTLDAREIVIRTGLGHGFLYRPLPAWLNPVVEWAVAP